MNKDLLFALIQNPYLISGIYNYCDGWCERCSFTSNCLNYKMMEEGVPDLDSSTSDASSAMDNLDEMFQLSMELLKQSAKDLGMEIPDQTVNFDTEAEEKKDNLIFKGQIMQQADKYSDLVDNWFTEYEALLFVGSISLKELLDYRDEEEMSELEKEIFNAYEIIRWYQFIIPSKLFRSLRSKVNTEETGNAFYKHDSIASGKVALLSIDESIDAWTFFMHKFPETEDRMLPLLLILSGLRTIVEKVFPESRDFIRPGFDI
ncbi:hypothetical protein BZG02_15525 [Labilibaculum filiforme]|uniref:Uncharacterized protein n=1 Tax=Labilibaculum filiforme TaxID=1940526 RepID=A0A2N3HU52_9BACT|nr:hypothetical protein [Labilibaculum filiforme]PKQ61595.1 hypothetical protein BZG02_15525 [Labilibaculum filiforme]